MIPFTSAEILGEGYRAYNFYLSQLRICIEMAFGLLTTKWRKLRSTLNFATCKNAQIIQVCTKLHNFVICMAHAEGNGAVRLDDSKEIRLILRLMEFYHWNVVLGK